MSNVQLSLFRRRHRRRHCRQCPTKLLFAKQFQTVRINAMECCEECGRWLKIIVLIAQRGLFAQLLNTSITQARDNVTERNGTTRLLQNECLHLRQHSPVSWYTIHLRFNRMLQYAFVSNSHGSCIGVRKVTTS